MKVRVVHLGNTLMDQQLDDESGQMLQKQLEERGVEFLMGASTKEIIEYCKAKLTGRILTKDLRAAYIKDGEIKAPK